MTPRRGPRATAEAQMAVFVIVLGIIVCLSAIFLGYLAASLLFELTKGVQV